MDQKQKNKRNPWIIKPPGYPKSPSDIKIRIFCFPQAGSSATMYKDWQSSFPSSIEILPIEYPGHNSRMREPLAQSMNDLITPLVNGILPLLKEDKTPFCFFGHSLGSWVAYETTIALQKLHAPLPRILFCSAIRSPTLSQQDIDPVSMHTLPQDQFWSKMQQRYGMSTSTMDPVLKDLSFPVLQADFKIAETYTPLSNDDSSGVVKVSVPLCVMGGVDDTMRYNKAQLDQWIDCIASSNDNNGSGFEVRMFKGGHNYAFSVEESQDDAIQYIIQQIDQRILSNNNDTTTTNTTNTTTTIQQQQQQQQQAKSDGGDGATTVSRDGSVRSGVSDAMATMGSGASYYPPSTIGGIESGWQQKMNRDDVDSMDDGYEAPSPRVGCFDCVFCRRRW